MLDIDALEIALCSLRNATPTVSYEGSLLLLLFNASSVCTKEPKCVSTASDSICRIRKILKYRSILYGWN